MFALFLSVITSPFYAVAGFLAQAGSAAMWLVRRDIEAGSHSTEFSVRQIVGRTPPTLILSFKQNNPTRLLLYPHSLQFNLCCDGVAVAHFEGIFEPSRLYPRMSPGPFIGLRTPGVFEADLIPRIETWMSQSPKAFQVQDGELVMIARLLKISVGKISLPVRSTSISFPDTDQLRKERDDFHTSARSVIRNG